MKNILIFSLLPVLWSAPFLGQAHHHDSYFDGYIDISNMTSNETTANNPCHSCEAVFHYTPLECGKISFRSQSASTSSTSYLWNFGDGQTSDIANPTHQYTTDGKYQICLSITDNFCVDQICNMLSVTVDHDPPIISCVQAVHPYPTDPGECTATVSLNITAMDNCKFSLTCKRSDGLNCNAPFPIGRTMVYYTAVDESGNTSNCSISIAVEDREGMGLDLISERVETTSWFKKIRDSFFICPCYPTGIYEDNLMVDRGPTIVLPSGWMPPWGGGIFRILS